jgi:hypothetical protein
MLCWFDLEVGHYHYYSMRWVLLLRYRQRPNKGLHDHCQPCMHQ